MTIYIIINVLVLFLVSKISYKLNLTDLPNKRKMHLLPVANTGGLAISLVYILSVFLFNNKINELNAIIHVGFLMGLVGFLDDRVNLNVGGKLSLQILPIIFLIMSEKLNLIHLGYYDYFKLELNSFSIPFTIIAVLFLINSFNYFDGIDGSLGFSVISILGILLYLLEDEKIRFFLILILVPIILFLFFNFSFLKINKLFLGDSGSLLLGFIIAFILVYFANEKLIHPILLAFSVSIFVYEFISINLIRLNKGQNLFKPRKDHLHHILFKKTKSVFLTNCFLVLSNSFIFIIGYFSFLFISPAVSLILFVFLFLVYLSLRINYSKLK